MAFMLIRVNFAIVQAAFNKANSPNLSKLLTPDNYNQAAEASAEISQQRILSHLSYLTKKYLRVSDAVFSFDDSHIAVILPHTNEIQALRAAEKLLELIDNQSVFGHVGLNVRQWLAIGISTFPYLSNNPESLIKHAQQAVARVKRQVDNPRTSGSEVGGKTNNKESQLPIQIWKATKVLSSQEINMIGDEMAVRAVMRGFQYTDLHNYIDQVNDPKKRIKFKAVFDTVPAELIHQYQLAPLSLKKLAGTDALTVAMADPTNNQLVAQLSRITGASIIAVAARSDQLQQLIDLIALNH